MPSETIEVDENHLSQEVSQVNLQTTHHRSDEEHETQESGDNHDKKLVPLVKSASSKKQSGAPQYTNDGR